MENTEATQQAAEKEPNKVTLLSAISYTNRSDYESFLEKMTGEHAIVALIAAANHAQTRGAYTLDEAELVSRAIRKLTVQPEAATPATETVAETAKKVSAKPATNKAAKKSVKPKK